AMESLWETSPEGEGADQTLILIPDEKNERNLVELIKIPNALSLLAYHRPDAEVKGLKEWPKEERPPVLVSFLAFRTMVGLGFLFIPIALLGFVYYGPDRSRLPGYGLVLGLRKRLERFPRLPWIFILAIPLPYLALQCGWILTEMGRQPWIVYGHVKTSEAASTLAAGQVWTTLLGFLLVYGLLGIINFYLVIRFARQGPEASQSTDAGGEV
ncbi:MAG: cytochrome ubiquinol oxidase subunit I, partial [bacterium]